jgi:hypothetical protein
MVCLFDFVVVAPADVKWRGLDGRLLVVVDIVVGVRSGRWTSVRIWREGERMV